VNSVKAIILEKVGGEIEVRRNKKTGKLRDFFP
jgi:hypothetical protein